MMPAQCIRVEVVIHQTPDRSVACWAYEVSNPHSSELLAKHVQPYVMAGEHQDLPGDVSEALELAVRYLLAPDPF